MLIKTLMEYNDGDVTLEGYYVYDDKLSGKRPAVLVAHDWSGKNDFSKQKADELAELGYVGFALDMYGKGKTGNTKEEKTALMQPLMADRNILQARMIAAVEAAKTIENVDITRIAAIGFCFGGLCALDLARTGADIKGVASFHGLFQAPENTPTPDILAKVLVLHGFDDPMATPEQSVQFGKEMTERKADWQLNMYGNTMHGFTNPAANDPSFGTVYNKGVAERAWASMVAFLAVCFK